MQGMYSIRTQIQIRIRISSPVCPDQSGAPLKQVALQLGEVRRLRRPGLSPARRTSGRLAAGHLPVSEREGRAQLALVQG